MANVTQGIEIIPYLSYEEELMPGMESLSCGLSKNNQIAPFTYDLFSILKDYFKRKGVYQWKQTTTSYCNSIDLQFSTTIK